MAGVLTGFGTIGSIIALGVVLAHIGLLDLKAQHVLSRLSFFVANPALMLTVLSAADVGELLSVSLAATACGVAACVAVYIPLARWVWRRSAGETVIGALCASYVNAGNLGVPVAAYVLGDAALVAPVLLLQLLVLQPLALMLLDMATAEHRVPWSRALTRPLANPLTVAAVVGVALSVVSWELPGPIVEPLTLIAGMAVPAMLLAYGVSLRLGPRPGHGATAWELGTIGLLKLVVQPLVVYLVARFAFGLDGHVLLAVTVLSALPAAQNIFVNAVRYGQAVVVARDSIFVTTLLSVPAVFAVVALLA